MTAIRLSLLAALCSVILVGCQHQNRDTYNYDEIGKSSAVSFGTILAVRKIKIIGKNTGGGAAVGGAAGAGAGAYVGSGSGKPWAIGAGALAGAVAGAAAEQAASNRQGVEYTIILESGVTLTIAQEAPANEPLLHKGQRVIVQNSGGYQRVLPADNLPTEVKRPKGIKLKE